MLEKGALFYIYDAAVGGPRPVTGSQVDGDNVNDESSGVNSVAFNYGYNGQNAWDRIRTANEFGNALLSEAGEVVLFDPDVGNFRLMGANVSIAGTLAAPAIVTLELLNGAGGAVIARVLAAVGVAVGGDTQAFINFDNGLLLDQAVLVANLSHEFVLGGAAINFFGVVE